MIAVHTLGLWAWDYILSKFLLRDEVNFTVAVGLQTFISDQKIKNRLFAAGAILIAVPIVSILLPTKNFASGLQLVGDKG